MLEALTFATVILSLLFLGRQSREVARQTRISNQTAGVAGVRDSLTHLHLVVQTFVEHPELRRYFYGGIDPPTDPGTLAQVETVAEMLADCLEASLEAGHTLDPFAPNLGKWQDYSRDVLAKSPAMCALVAGHEEWYPRVAAELRRSEGT